VESFHGTHSIITAEDSSTDGGESLFVNTPLKPESYDIEGLRSHIKSYRWDAAGRNILQGLLGNRPVIERAALFPVDLETSDDRSHLSFGSIVDVGEDGTVFSPLMDHGKTSRSLEIWHRLQSTNHNTDHKSVGKLICVREPSPLLFAALHYTMQKHFDMDELLGFLVDRDPVLARPHDPFSDDHRRRRSFVFNMEYFTLVGEGCEPMHWQRFDHNFRSEDCHIPLTRCSAALALSFEGDYVSTVRNKNRRMLKRIGHVYDPFSPWRVLVIQAYPDWESTFDVDEDFQKRRHVVNGPEAFLTALRHELKDASKRLLKVFREIENLVQVPDDFIFDLSTRDKLLFEDDEFTYSRRYVGTSVNLLHNTHGCQIFLG